MKSEEHYVVSKDDLQTRNQNMVQPESSSVDTEIEVSIKNANLLTNLAKVVQEKEKNDLLNQNSESKEKGNPLQMPFLSLLQEDLWLFSYEE